jgi:hypothetical protein
MSVRKTRSPRTVDYRAKCDAPVEQFVHFAKGLQRAKKSLEALAASPAADHFVNRLLAEASSGQAHAAACLYLIGRFASDHFWAEKLRSKNQTADPPHLGELRPKDVEAASRALLLILPHDAAIAWIAYAYLNMKSAPALRIPVQDLLLENTTTPDKLLEALSRALAATEFNAKTVPRSSISRAIATIETFAERRSSRIEQTETRSEFARLTGSATRAELTRLVSAVLSLQHGRSDTANAEAAWTLADDALARALQGAAALTHTLDLTTDVDSRVKGYAEIVTQAVESVAAKRELELQGTVGETTEYDPALHHDDFGVKPHSLVRIRRPAVAQGKENWRRIIRKAEIAPN